MKRIKPYLDYLKEYSSVFSLLPFFAGGLWQVLELAFISPSYIRFFSPSQLIADGLLTLFICLIIGAGSWFGIKRLSNYDFELKKEKEKSYSKILKKVSLFGIILFGIIFFFGKDLYSMLTLKMDMGLAELTMLIFVASLVIFLSLDFLLLSITLIVKYTRFELIISNRLKSFFKELYESFLVFIMLFLPILILPVFHNKYYFPKDLVNLSKMLENYSSEKKLPKDSINVLYINDKYIFLKSKEEVEILKFDDLFEDKVIKVKEID